MPTTRSARLSCAPDRLWHVAAHPLDLVVNNLVAWAFTTGEVFLKSDGSPWRPIVHVEDISAAYIAALEAPRETVHCATFNVGSTTENYQIREIAEMVREVVPGSKVAFASDAAPDKRCYRVDCNLIVRILHGFKPQWTARPASSSCTKLSAAKA